MGNQQAKKEREEKLKAEKEKKELEELEEKEKLIGTAVLFLGGDKVKSIPEVQKRIFLRKKGLSEEMINEAYKRLKQKEESPQEKPQTLNLEPPKSADESCKKEKK